MTESTQNKISKIYQILSGKIQNKRADYPLFEWDTLLDFLLSFYDEFCDPTQNNRDKAIGMFNKLYSENVKELKNLRISKNDFDVVKTIGKGHFGEVIVVKEKNTSNVYAMKVLKKAATLSQDNMAFFFEERDIMAFANSEWVTPLHYAFQDYECLYLVMDFLPGGDLLALLNRYEDSVVDEETCKFYLSEIIIATNCVHKIGYVHRDIKPENVLIDLTGHIKLADFGSAARLVNGKQVFGKMPVGTPEYIAPEVLTSMDSGGGRYGVGCDYWSIGVVAYEMLFGTLPFESDSVLQLYNQIMHFKENLEFPTNDDDDDDDPIEIKEETKNLICGLICDQKERLAYSELAQHEFFKNLDWTTIKNIPPPHVPVVTSRTDTSNFDTINTSSGVPLNKSGVKKSKGFSGSNYLPFIGFTFTRSLQQQLREDTTRNINGFINKVNSNSVTGAGTTSLTVAEEEPSFAAAATANKNLLSTSEIKEEQEVIQKENKDVTDRLINEYKTLTTELEDAKRELERTKKDLTASQSEVTRVEGDKQFYVQEADKLKIRYKELTWKYDITVEQNNKIDSEGHRLLSDLFSMFNCGKDFEFKDVKQSSGIVAKIRAEYEALKSEKDESANKVHALTSEISMLSYRVDLLTKNIKDNEDRYNTSYGELHETIANLQSSLEKTNKDSESSVASLRQNCAESELRINTLTAELEEALKISASIVVEQQQQQQQQQQSQPPEPSSPEQDPQLLGVLQSDLNTANSSVNLLTSENGKLTEKLAELSELNLKLKNEMISLENRTETLTKGASDAESEGNKLKNSISNKNMIISELNEKISALDRSQVELMCEHELLVTKLKSKEQLQLELENKVGDLKMDAEKQKTKDSSDIQQLTCQLKLTSNKMTSLTQEVEDKLSSEKFYKTSLSNCQQEISKLSDEVKQLEKNNDVLGGETQKYKDTIHTQKLSNYALTELIERLKDDVTLANNETRQIFNDFDEFKASNQENVIRLSETLKQQEKLIEFLQSMNVRNKKPLKADTKDDHHSVDVTSKLKKERTTRIIGRKSMKPKNKLIRNSKESISANISQSTTTTTIDDDISKDSLTQATYNNNNISSVIMTPISQRISTAAAPAAADDNSSSRNDSIHMEYPPTAASTPQSISRPVSTFHNTTNEPLSIQDDIEKVSLVIKQSPHTVVRSNTDDNTLDMHDDQTNMSLNDDVEVLLNTSTTALATDSTRHTFTERLNLCKNICMVCYNIIQFGVPFSACKVCYLRCHVDCCDNTYVQCVQGEEYDWFCYIPTVRYCENSFCTRKTYTTPAMGWVSMLAKIIKTKTEWEQRWMVVTNDTLSFYKHAKTVEDINNAHHSRQTSGSGGKDPDLIESLCFLPGDFSVHSNLRSSDTLTYAGTIDSRSYWCIKVTPKYTTISKKKNPQSCSLLFSSSLQDKTYWVAVLSHLFNQYTISNKRVKQYAQNVHFLESIDTKNLFNICYTLTLNNDISLVATSNELFLYSNNNQKNCHLFKLSGLTFVSGMAHVKDYAFIIVGKTRLLIKIEAKVLMNELKSKVPTTFDVTKLAVSTQFRNCHLVKAGKCNGEHFVAVGIGSRFILLKPSTGVQLMDISFNSLIKNIHFTSIGVIYQTDVVHIINIKNGDVVNFFDPDDTTLSVQIFGQASSYNYLLDVFTLKNKKTHHEFLFCYSELGIRVNQDGQRTGNNDLIWTDVPTEFHMVGTNLLCVCYYDRIDAYDLSDLSASSNNSSFNIRISYPVLSPTIIHHTSTSIHVCGSDVEGNFSLYKLDLP